MQLLDENHILIRYASEEVATIKIQEPNTQASFFMIYNMVSTMVKLSSININEDMNYNSVNFHLIEKLKCTYYIILGKLRDMWKMIILIYLIEFKYPI